MSAFSFPSWQLKIEFAMTYLVDHPCFWGFKIESKGLTVHGDGKWEDEEEERSNNQQDKHREDP